MRSAIIILCLAAGAGMASYNYHGVAVAPDGMNSWVVTIETTLVFHSSDFAATWEEQEVLTIRDFFDVCFLDDMTGWTCGRLGDIWHTENGGDSWYRQNLGGPKFATRVRFYDDNIGWAAGGEAIMLYTTNGGSEWQMTFFPNPPFPSDTVDFYGVHFHHPDTGWLVAGRFPSGDTFARGQGYITRTVDGGANWELVRRDTVYDLYDVFFLDGSNGWVVGGNDQTMDGVVLRTTNGGTDWSEQSLPSGTKFLRSLAFVGGQHAWACGRNGTIIHSSDGGTSWERQGTPVDTTLFDIEFADTLRGMVAGNSVVLYTTDGGEHWIRGLGAVGEGREPAPVPGAAVKVLENPARGVVRFQPGMLDGGGILLYDATGRRIRTLPVPRGTSVVEWDGIDESGNAVASGVYLVQVVGRAGPACARFTYLAAGE